MNFILKFSSPFLLNKLLQGYSDTIRKMAPQEIPSLMDFLEGNEKLESGITQYKRLLRDQKIKVPTLHRFWKNTFFPAAIQQASDKVSAEFLKYKERMISQGPEKVFESSYYNDIAANIAYFFEAFEDQVYLFDEESLVRILDCSLRDGFFEHIMDYASDCETFDVSNLSATGDEIKAYCNDCCINEAA